MASRFPSFLGGVAATTLAVALYRLWSARQRKLALQGLPGWEGWSLVVVDIQRDFYSKHPSSQNFPDFGRKVSELLQFCRNAGIEVVHLREGSNPVDSPWYAFWQRMNPGKSSTVDPLAEEAFSKRDEGEALFIKYAYDGVGVDCGLEDYLRRKGHNKVLVCGLVTSCCVHLNAAGLFHRGYEVYVVGDCCADRSNKIHSWTLSSEARRTYAVISLDDVRRLTQEGPDLDLIALAAPNSTQFEK